MNALILLTLATPRAQAWTHTEVLFKRAEFPVEWYMSDYVTDELPEDYQVEVQETSINAWQRDAPCAQLSTEYMGVREGHWATGANPYDGYNTMYYDDPAQQNGDSAVGVTYYQSSGEFAFELRDPNNADQVIRYEYSLGADIVYSTGYDFYTSDEVDEGLCQGGGYAIEGIATHEFGHFWGIGHTCDLDSDTNRVDPAVCNEEDFYTATMFPTATNCSNEMNSLDTEDIEAITALYGPFALLTTVEGSERYGGVPLEVCFDLETKGVDQMEGDLVVEWNFGDGATSSEMAPCHTYTEKGQYTVFITVTGSDEACGEFSYDYREPAYVLACEVPQAAEGFDGMFTYEWVEGTTYQMVNQADLSVYGCIDQVQWDVFKGGELQQSISAWSPKIDFGAEGTYEVFLNLGGPGGISAEKIEITVGGEGGTCSALPVTSGLAGLLIGLSAAIRRRRS